MAIKTDTIEKETNVMDFGAVGDGITDDTTAINNAITSASAGSTIYFPSTSNYYKISDNLVINKLLTIEGDGIDSEIRQTVDGKQIFRVSVSNVTIKDLNLVGTGAPSDNSVANSYAIYAFGADKDNYIEEIKIYKCNISSWKHSAIFFDFVKKFEMASNIIKTISYVGFSGQHVNEGRIHHNSIDDIKCLTGVGGNGFGIYLAKSSGDVATYPKSSDILIEHNHISNVATWAGIRLNSVDRVVIDSNIITNCPKGITNAYVEDFYGSHDVSIIGNTLDSGVTDGSASIGIWFGGGISQNLVQNGDFTVDTDPPPSWTASNSTLTTEAGGQSGNCMMATNVGTNQGRAYQNITTVVGKIYEAIIYFKIGTCTDSRILVGTALGDGSYLDTSWINDATWTQYSVIFTATTTTTCINTLNDAVNNGTAYFDTISLREVIPEGTGCIKGNTVRGYGDESADSQSGAINIYNTNGLVVSGNTIIEPSPYGIVVRYYNYGFNIEGNTIIDPWSNTGGVGVAIGIYVKTATGYNKGYIGGNSFIRGTKTATYLIDTPSTGRAIQVQNATENSITIGGNFSQADAYVVDSGSLSESYFPTLRVTNMTTTGFVKNDASGNLTGGNAASSTHYYAEDDTQSDYTTSSWTTKLTYTATEAGDYLVQWYFEVTASAINIHVLSQVLHNAAQIANVQFEPEDVAPTFWLSGGGLKKLTLAVDDTIKIEAASETTTQVSIRNARISLLKL